MRGVDRELEEGPRELSRGVTVAVTVLCVLFLLLAITYLVEPAEAMPSIVPGAAPNPGFAHRYSQATGAFLLSLFLGSVASLRWRLHRLAGAVRRPPQVTAEDVNLFTDA